MRLILQKTILAGGSQIVLANPDSVWFEGNGSSPDGQESRRGFFAGDGTYITQSLTHDCWRVTVQVFRADSAPTDWSDADRVVALPIRVGDYEELLLGGFYVEQRDMDCIELPNGDYTVYSIARSLFKAPSNDQLELSFEAFADLTDIERYDFVLVPGKCEHAILLKGPEYLFER